MRLLTRKGKDLAGRFPFIALAVAALPVRSCLIDGEAIVCDDSGVAVFNLIRGHRVNAAATHCAFDLIELDGEDLRRAPIEERRDRLQRLVRGAPSAIALNEAFDAAGEIVYRHACRLGCEGIVSKRRGSPYQSGRSPHWVKVKNASAPAVRREAEEDWS